ncbi:MAG: hypothetical protein ACQEQU_05685 [Spirochaetota bacterium]
MRRERVKAVTSEDEFYRLFMSASADEEEDDFGDYEDEDLDEDDDFDEELEEDEEELFEDYDFDDDYLFDDN